MMIGFSIYGVAVIDGSLYSRFYGIFKLCQKDNFRASSTCMSSVCVAKSLCNARLGENNTSMMQTTVLYSTYNFPTHAYIK